MSAASPDGAGASVTSGSVGSGSAEHARRAAASLGREAQTKILAALARRFGDLELAEDMLQEAFAQALNTWPKDGVPDSPEAWLMTTAKHKALDVVRRAAVQRRAVAQLASQQDRGPAPDGPSELVSEDRAKALADDRLGLFFACAHPAFRPEDRLALTLRFLAGLTTEEVARLLLVSVPTMQQRIVRAKRRIRTLGVSFELPSSDQLPERLADVRRVIYLLYTEGFSRSAGPRHIRDDLTAEAIRLARILHETTPGSAEATGLLALLLLTESRRPARTDERGHPIPLAEQDRRRWNTDLRREGAALAQNAAAAPGAASYAIQAAIAAVHSEADSFQNTDWEQITVLYKLLEGYESGPVVRLGRAIATGRARGADVGLRRLNELAGDPIMTRFRPFHIARAITLEELDDHPGAAAAYHRALQLPGNAAEESMLRTTLRELEGCVPTEDDEAQRRDAADS